MGEANRRNADSMGAKRRKKRQKEKMSLIKESIRRVRREKMRLEIEMDEQKPEGSSDVVGSWKGLGLFAFESHSWNGRR